MVALQTPEFHSNKAYHQTSAVRRSLHSEELASEASRLILHVMCQA
jgi:hypothetical protein